MDGVLKYNHVTNDPGINWACSTPVTTGVSTMGWAGPYDDLVILNQSLTDTQVASLYSSRDLSGALSTTCPNPCAANHYCPAGAGLSDTAIPCPNHLFSYAGASSVDDCISPVHSLWGSSNAWTCENGYQYVLDAGALGGFQCTPCVAGSFCVDGVPTLCAAATYSPTAGASVCLACPAGTPQGPLCGGTVLREPTLPLELPPVRTAPLALALPRGPPRARTALLGPTLPRELPRARIVPREPTLQLELSHA